MNFGTRHCLIPVALLASFAAAADAQQPAPTRVLTVSGGNATAASEFQAGTDAYFLWSGPVASERLSKAMELDGTFGLARAYLARVREGPTARAEYERAAAEATHGSAGEALLALAMREVNAGRSPVARTLLDAAATLLPDDPIVAIEVALLKPAGNERIDALRRVSSRFPQFAPSRMFLALNLAPRGFDSIPAAAGAEAVRVAQEALRLAPQVPGTHTALAWTLVQLNRYDDAAPHLGHATTMAAPNEYAFELKADIAIHTGKPALARAALDSAYDVSVTVGNRSAYKRNRALMFLHEGKVRETMAAMDTLARTDEEAGRNVQAQGTHNSMAIIAAATRDSALAEQHLAEARRLGATGAGLADNEVIVYFQTGQGAKARASLARYIDLTKSASNMTSRDQSVHRLTGLTLIAENRMREAITELRLGGSNPWVQVGLLEAYRKLGDKKAYEAERTALNTRPNWTYQSTAVPIAKYRIAQK